MVTQLNVSRAGPGWSVIESGRFVDYEKVQISCIDNVSIGKVKDSCQCDIIEITED